MEQESEKKPRTQMFLRVLFGVCLPQTSLRGKEMLKRQRGTADRAKALWAEAATSSDPVSEVRLLQLGTVREV